MPEDLSYLQRKVLGLHMRWRKLRSGVRCLGLSGLGTSLIPTYSYPEELTALYNIARSVPRVSQAVEIGSYHGVSTCYLASAMKKTGGKLTCVDTWLNTAVPDQPRDIFHEFQHNTRAFSPYISVIRRNSRELNPADLPKPIHMAFIDGDHSFEAALADFELLRPNVPVNGIVAFHDCSRLFPGVPRAIGTALQPGGWLLGGIVKTLCWLVRIE